ncbi:MAG: hypothetical protein LN414_05105 [Candidatus Thermoplasmatota archaeon]|nr:hypothetical protein [Candidatus Thermoplasmatota archaeon]
MPSRKEVLAVALVIIVVCSVIIVYTDVYDDNFSDTCGWEPPTLISLEPSSTEARRVDISTVWDAWFVCTGLISPRKIPWTGVSFWLDGDNSAIYGGGFGPVPDAPDEGRFPPRGYYRDVVGKPTLLDVGDYLCIAGLNRQHQGMPFRLGAFEYTRENLYNFPDADVPYTLDLTLLNTSIPRKGSNIWDVTFSVRSVEPGWEELPWSYIRTRDQFTHRVHDGYEYFPLRPISSLDKRRSGSLIGYYNDSGELDGYVDVGDRIVVTGDWSAYEGGKGASLYTGNASIADMEVPFLPDTQIQFDFSYPILTSRTLPENEIVWDCEFVIEGIEPEQGYLEWGNPRVNVPGNTSGLDIPWWANSEKENYPTSTQVFFREVEPVDGRVDVGDVVVIKRLTKAFEGKTLVMEGPGTWIRLTMPTHFDD